MILPPSESAGPWLGLVDGSRNLAVVLEKLRETLDAGSLNGDLLSHRLRALRNDLELTVDDLADGPAGDEMKAPASPAGEVAVIRAVLAAEASSISIPPSPPTSARPASKSPVEQADYNYFVELETEIARLRSNGLD